MLGENTMNAYHRFEVRDNSDKAAYRKLEM